jgi:hypothetical protein
MGRYNRRHFVTRGGALAAAVGAAPLVGANGIEQALAAVDPSALTRSRRGTYSALVEAVALADVMPVDGSDVAGTTTKFATLYRTRSATGRRAADAVLDHIESAPGGPFSQRGPRARLAQLRDWVHAGGDDAETFRHRAFAVAALELAATPFYPHGVDDPNPIVAI